MQDGVIDRPAGIRLDGEWEFYWLKYLTNCESNDAPDAFIPVPSVWNSHMIASNPIPVQGFATYRLKIVSDKPIGDVAFFFRDMSTAFRFYVDGKLLIQNGVPGTNRETTLEQYLPTARSVSISGNQAELIVQCANYEYCKSGLWNSIEMGRPEFVESAFKNFIYVDIFLIGGLLIMSIYHFGLYALRRRDLSPADIRMVLSGHRDTKLGDGGCAYYAAISGVSVGASGQTGIPDILSRAWIVFFVFLRHLSQVFSSGVFLDREWNGICVCAFGADHAGQLFYCDGNPFRSDFDYCRFVCCAEPDPRS